ncbi:hypothetical protein LSAT2_022624 [Lamellibrachia satsuma]|nr:hypothetical protein LSAT2_022624 [Lamellibrachia satsuma]
MQRLSSETVSFNDGGAVQHTTRDWYTRCAEVSSKVFCESRQADGYNGCLERTESVSPADTKPLQFTCREWWQLDRLASKMGLTVCHRTKDDGVRWDELRNACSVFVAALRDTFDTRQMTCKGIQLTSKLTWTMHGGSHG